MEIIEVGIDEVGKGSYCGPLVICAYFGVNFSKEIKDSKIVSLSKIKKIYFLESKENYLIEEISYKTLNEKMLSKISLVDIEIEYILKIIIKLINLFPNKFLKINIDSFLLNSSSLENKIINKLTFLNYNLKNILINCKIKADSIYQVVSYSSIIAKGYREFYMEKNLSILKSGYPSDKSSIENLEKILSLSKLDLIDLIKKYELRICWKTITNLFIKYNLDLNSVS